MKPMNLDLLKRLCETPGVPGHERRVRDLIQAEIAGLFDEVPVSYTHLDVYKRQSQDSARPIRGTVKATKVRTAMNPQLSTMSHYLRKVVTAWPESVTGGKRARL